MLRALSAFFLFVLAGCAPKHIDPPVYTYDSMEFARVSAEAHAHDLRGTVYIVADTHSMEPLLVRGDLIVTAKLPFDSIVVGQVITYQAEWLSPQAAPVTHRVVSVDGAGLLMSGDNNAHSEPQYRVRERSYLGTVEGIYRAKQ